MKSFSEIAQYAVRSNRPQNLEKRDVSFKSSQPTLDEILSSWDFSDVFPLCSQMRDWQHRMFRSLNYKDLYVAARPGAGKTLPYTCFWLSHILGLGVVSGGDPKSYSKYVRILDILLNEPERVAKLVVLVPIRSLATQTAEEFKRAFAGILSSYIGKFLQIAIDTRPFTKIKNYEGVYKQHRDRILRVINPDLVHIINEKERLFREFQDLRDEQERLKRNNQVMQGSFEKERRINELSKQLDEKFYQAAQNGLNKVISGLRGDYAFVAERTGLGTSGDIRRAPVLVTIYESGLKAIKEAGEKNVALLVCDEAHLTQKDKNENDPRSYNIAGALYDILKAMRGVNYRLLFLSGTANPNSAKNLAKYINSAFERNIEVVDTPSTASNPSDVQIVANDSLYDERYLLNLIKSPNNPSNVIIIFSKKKIDDLTAKALKGSISNKTLQQIEGGYHQRTGYSSMYKIPERRYGTPDQTINPKNMDFQKMASIASKGKEAADIHDKVLRLAVQSGFGYIYRLDDDARDFDQRKHDNHIVARLFQEKKIKTILSTDAVGIGMNISVQNMYIPSIMKPTGSGQRKEMNPAQLAQLLHRTGRMAFKASRIYTPAKFIGSVKSAFDMSPSDFTPTITITQLTTDMLRSKKFFLDLWRA